jgi:hypothetical protein
MVAAREPLNIQILAETDTHATEKRCFLRGPYRDVISKGLGQLVCEGKTRSLA